MGLIKITGAVGYVGQLFFGRAYQVKTMLKAVYFIKQFGRQTGALRKKGIQVPCGDIISG